MPLGQESLQDHIPSYLTQDAKDNLAKALREFPHGTKYYLDGAFPDEILQGDGWSRLEIVGFEEGQHKHIRGVVLSNSCDIAPENPRATPILVTFVPIVPLAAYCLRLKQSGLSDQAINSKVAAIRLQEVTQLFYLPTNEVLNEEHIALLDDVHTVPMTRFEKEADRKKVFTLSQVGFYIFVFKLSVHFCRFHEAVDRDNGH